MVPISEPALASKPSQRQHVTRRGRATGKALPDSAAFHASWHTLTTCRKGAAPAAPRAIRDAIYNKALPAATQAAVSSSDTVASGLASGVLASDGGTSW